MAIRSKTKAILAPSLLSADFSKLGEEIKTVEKAGADWLHVDVMDGHFVPNLTLGPLVVEAIRPLTRLPLDCHLMVSEPERWIEPFAKAGADVITVHVESTCHLNRLLNQIRDAKCKVGVTLNPATPLVMIEDVLDLVDLVLIMSVNPGFGGQKFIESTFEKVERLAQIRATRQKKQGDSTSFLIQVDGGVNSKNIGRLRQLGADAFVVGSAVFSASDRSEAVAQLRTSLEVG